MSNTLSILVVVVATFANGEETASKETGIHALTASVKQCNEYIAPFFSYERTFEYEGVNHAVRTIASCYGTEQYMEKHHEGMNHEEHHEKMQGDSKHDHNN